MIKSLRKPRVLSLPGGSQLKFNKDSLTLDPSAETDRIVGVLREQVLGRLRRRGAVVGLSGGIDSSVVAALCVRAFGNEKVLGLLMPERHSSDDALRLGRLLAAEIGIQTIVEDIAPAAAAVGVYRRQADAIRQVVPGFDDRWKFKLVLPSILDADRLNVTLLTVEDPDGVTSTHRLSPEGYRQVVGATNYKQRIRKMTEYYHADRLHYAVAGTPNRLEYDQGFFVKHGDGAADFKPIAHLYKTQVYQLAEYLGVPEEIRSRPPTTDTFSMPQTQEEFYFSLPYDLMDLCLHAVEEGIGPEEAAPVLGLTVDQVERVYKDIAAKRRAAEYLHQQPLLVAGPEPGLR